MTKIRVLPDGLVNQIAAGEVVERPASVLKELVENAVDAGARVIEVAWDGAGKKLISVSDDGCGMDATDALLALERHATSKISAYDDLFALSTMGFRGEALPSIASVSRLTLLTCADGEQGTHIIMEGGIVRASEPRFRKRGTTVIVEDLFFNTPARRQFLRADVTEQKFLHRVFTSMALAHPEVEFRLQVKGRTASHYPAAACGERFFQVIGADLEKAFQRKEMEGAGLAMELFLSREYLTLPVPVFHHLTVNHRPVQDRMIYGVLKDLHPNASWALFITIAPNLVDVNIHPAKTEVRFHRPHTVLELLGRRPEAPPDFFGARPVFPGPSSGMPLSVQEGLLDLETREIYAWRYLGQVDAAFMVFEETGGLVLVDPHAAHERILFEELTGDKSREVQRLLLPQVVELSGEEENHAMEVLAALQDLGFDVDWAGPRRLRLNAQPRLLGPDEGPAFLRTFLGTEGATPLQRRILASIACRRAVKIHQTLGQAEAQALLQQLRACREPDHCPHGRPTLLRLSRNDLYRYFGRPTPSD